MKNARDQHVLLLVLIVCVCLRLHETKSQIPLSSRCDTPWKSSFKATAMDADTPNEEDVRLRGPCRFLQLVQDPRGHQW